MLKRKINSLLNYIMEFQRNMIVAQYLAMFLRISRYFPELVSTEEKKAKKFQRGLWYDVGGRISLMRFETMEQVVLAANKAQDFNEEGTNKSPAKSAPTFDDPAAKRPNYQPNRPPPPRYQGGGPQSCRPQASNNNYQRPQVWNTKI